MNSVSLRRVLAVPLVAVLAVSLGSCGVIGGNKKPKSTPTLGKRMPVLSRIESDAKVDPALASVAVVLPTAEANAEWGQPGGNAAKSYGNLALAASPTKAWTASIAGSKPSERLAAAPVIGGGQLFVFDTSGEVHAFDATTGAAKWTTKLRMEKNNSSVFGGGVSYADGRVYATTGLGEVAALDATNGSQIWRVKPSGPLRGSPTIANDAIYVMTQDNQIIALNAADGKPLWNETASQATAGVFGVAAPAAAQGTVIAGYSSGELTAYRYENGRQLWSDALARTSIATSVSTLTDIDADPIIDRGRVYALGQGGRMAAYELVTGQRIWELNLAGISTPAIAGEWVFVLTDDSRLLCLARATGKVRWIAQLQQYKNDEKKKGEYYWTGPVLAGDRLWVANTRGEVFTVNAADGTMAPFTKLGNPVSLAPVVANNTLYILDDGGKITAFR
jgi:outer membrane protein assembly factor BamB